MGSVWLSLRADLRVRWRPLAALALLLGLIGGVVLTAAAGARRTDTAYPRLLQWAGAAQVDLLPEGNASPLAYFAAVARLPQVAALSVGSDYQMVIPVRTRWPSATRRPPRGPSPPSAWLTRSPPRSTPSARTRSRWRPSPRWPG